MPDGADLDAIRTLYDSGVQLLRTSRPRRAEGVLRRALAAVGDPPASRGHAVLKARALISLAYADFELRGHTDASARLDEAAREVRKHGLVELGVLLHMQRGLLDLRVGRLAAAVEEFDRADTHRFDAPASDRSILLINRAVVELELGDVRAARRDLLRCTEEAAAADLHLLRVKATHNLGWVEFAAGNLPAALEMMDAAYAMDPSLAPGVSFLGKAQVLVEAGLLREADETLAVAVRMLRTEGMSRDLAEAELERARCALAVGNSRAARSLATSARNRFRGKAGEGWRRAAELVVLQSDLATERSPRRLVEPALRLSEQFAAEGLRLHARIAGLIAAEARLAADDVAGADQLLGRVDPPRRGDPITGRMHFRYVRARVDAASGRRSAATRVISAAFADLARYQASFGSIDLRTASAVHGRRLADLDIALALESGRAAAVFAAAERARAVSSRLPAVRPPADPAAADLLAELRQTIDSLRAVEQDHEASKPLLRKRRDLERRIVARTWTRPGTGPADRPAALSAVRAEVVGSEGAMVTYVQAGRRLSAVVLGRRLRLYDLGPGGGVVEHVRRVRADLDVLAHPRLPAPIRAAVRASLERSLRALDEALLAPLHLEGPLVVVSTGVLGQLPWGSLPSLRGRPLVVAPSATKWLASTEASSGGSTGVVALSGPELGRGAEEAAGVAAMWPAARARTGRAATAAAFTEAMGSATVLHVAAHGVHQPENPLFSFVRMVDGPVFAHELDHTHRAPQHVVLSACEVGLATIRPGDEALGLASVLLQLGTRSVIAGVARVGDEVAEQTMVTYHARLAGGADSAVALSAALAEVDGDVVPPFVNFGAAWSADLETASPVA